MLASFHSRDKLTWSSSPRMGSTRREWKPWLVSIRTNLMGGVLERRRSSSLAMSLHPPDTTWLDSELKHPTSRILPELESTVFCMKSSITSLVAKTASIDPLSGPHLAFMRAARAATSLRQSRMDSMPLTAKAVSSPKLCPMRPSTLSPASIHVCALAYCTATRPV